jgi:hypothetical protein
MKDGIFKKEAKFMMGMYLAFPVIGLLAVVLGPYLMKHTTCENSIIAVLVSPDGVKKAVVFARDCGATTGFSTQISIIPSQDKLPDESGNTFVADSDHGKASIGRWGGPLVEVAWKDGTNIIVNYAEKAQVFKKQELVAGIKISYSEGVKTANQAQQR